MIALLILAFALQDGIPAIPQESLDAARMIDFHIQKVSSRHNEQFVDAWIAYNQAFEAWWRLTQQSASGVTVDGTPVYHIELLQATGQLKKAAQQLLREAKLVFERLEDLEKATKKAPPK